MYLKSLEIKGFKSFPDRTVIDFPKGMICIAGPNGSGKSNILDAIRWVLGEQSVKELRGEKLEDVIFVGTKLRSQMGYSEVIINIDNEDGKLPIDYTELSIKRKAYRSGESKFYINNNRCRLKDIKEILLDTGIGQEGYSLISQGKIDEIIKASSNELRLLLEEASGIAKHRYKKVEAEKNLISANDNLARIEDVYIEIERQFNPLKEQKEKAEKYIELTKKLKTFRVNKFLRELDKISENIDLLNQNNQKLEEIFKKEFENKKTLENRKLSLENYLAKIKEEIDIIKEEYEKNQSNLQSIEYEIKIDREKINNLESNNKSFDIELFELDKEKSKNIEKKEEYDKNIIELEKKIKTFINDKNEKINLLNIKKDELKEKNQHNINQEYKIQGIESEIKKLQTKSEMLQDTVKSLDEKITEYDREKTLFENNISDYVNKKTEKEKILSQKNLEKNEISCELNKNQEKLLILERDIENNKDTYQSRKTDFNVLLSQTNLLIKFDEDMQGVSKSVRTLVKDSNLRGIVDIISNVIQVKKGYEVAIETLLGNRTENIILENSSYAKNAINYLKKYRLGRATFLPLDTIRGSVIDYNDTGVRAIDVLDFNEKYRDIISFLIGKNIIVDDIDTALFISKKYNQTIRIATKEGELFNVGGAITGGDNKYSKDVFIRKNKIKENKISLKKMSEEIKKISELLLEKNKEKEKLLIENENNTSILNEIVKEIEILKNEISDIDFGLKSEEFQKNRVLTEVESIIKSNKVSKEAIDKNYKSISELGENLNILEEEYNKRSEEINEIRQNIYIFEKEIQELDIENTRITELYKSQKAFLNGIKNSEREIIEKSNRINEKVDKNLQEIQDLKNKIKLKDKEISILSDKILEQKEAILEKNIDVKEQEENITRLEDEISQNQDKNLELEKEKIIIKNKIDRERDRNNLIVDRLKELYDISIEKAREIEDKSINITTQEISSMINKINSLGNVNLDSIEEFEKINERYIFYSNQMEDLSNSISKIQKIIRELEKMMLTDFEEKFNIINSNFSKIFKILFGGGNAKLILEDEKNLLTSDIQISVQPPGKNLKKISMLSGGERALSAISLLFAIILCKPVPFCVLDEIDAPLDDLNIYRYVKFLRTLVSDTQFIVITHRRTTMEESDYMYGVSMPEKGVSKIVSIDLKEMDNYIDD